MKMFHEKQVFMVFNKFHVIYMLHTTCEDAITCVHRISVTTVMVHMWVHRNIVIMS